MTEPMAETVVPRRRPMVLHPRRRPQEEHEVPAPGAAVTATAQAAEIRTIAAMFCGDTHIYKVCATAGGVLLQYSRDVDSPAPALEAVGYTTTVLRAGLLLVTGGLDLVELLDAQIAGLTALREAMKRMP